MLWLYGLFVYGQKILFYDIDISCFFKEILTVIDEVKIMWALQACVQRTALEVTGRNVICYPECSFADDFLENGGLYEGQPIVIKGTALIGWNPCLENCVLHSLQPCAIESSSDWLKPMTILEPDSFVLASYSKSMMPRRHAVNVNWRERTCHWDISELTLMCPRCY